jgi:hypothetical protein
VSVAAKAFVPVAIVTLEATVAATETAILDEAAGEADAREGEKGDQQGFAHWHTPSVKVSFFNKRLQRAIPPPRL